MQLGVSSGSGVLLSDLGAEFNVFSNRVAETIVAREAGLVKRLAVRVDETVALLVGDVEMAMEIDQILKAELSAESLGPAEALGGEPLQVIKVGGDTLREEVLKDREAPASPIRGNSAHAAGAKPVVQTGYPKLSGPRTREATRCADQLRSP